MTELSHNPQPTRPLTFAALAASCILASGFVGGTTNIVNGAVSPYYFVTIMGWEFVDSVWRASIAQEIFEGLLFGIFFSLLFTVGTGILTGLECTYGFAMKHVAGIVCGCYFCWICGGLAGIGLASLSPDFYRASFRGVPSEFGPMIRYAWVGGSIWGVYFGGLASVILALVVLRASWLRR